MRTLAIGDVHGCRRALDALLARVAPKSDDLVITLGDYVDRGLDSAGVIDRLLELEHQCQVVALRGNHEELMLDARKDQAHLELWLNCGGDAALISYAPGSDRPTLADVPQEHWDFITQHCVDFYETKTHIFVHGGVKPDQALSEQKISVLRWQKFPPPGPHRSGKIVVCGHTPQHNRIPRNIGHAICIDTDACREGWLTCLNVDTDEIWQSNERGEVRTGSLLPPP